MQMFFAVKRPCWGTLIKGTQNFRPIATYARTSEWFLRFRFFLLFCTFISLPRFCMCHMYLLALIISRGQIEYLSRDYLIEWKFRYRHNKPSTVLINSDPDDGDNRLSETSVTAYQSTRRRIAEALNHWPLWEPQISHWNVFTKRPPQFCAHASFLLTIFPRDTCYSFPSKCCGWHFHYSVQCVFPGLFWKRP